MCEDSFGCHNLDDGAKGKQGVDVEDASKYPTMHRSLQQKYQAPHKHSAKVEKSAQKPGLA